MTKVKMWALLAVFAVVAIFAIGWIAVLSPQKAKVSDLHSQASQQIDANQVLKHKITLLKQEQTQIPAEQASIAAIQNRLPATPAIAAYVRSLTAAAAATNVELISVAPANPTTVAPPAPVATGTASSAASVPTPAPSEASSNLSAISISLGIVGDYYAVQQFLGKLESMQRVTIVSSVAMQPGQLPQPQGTGAAPLQDTSSQWKTLTTQIQATVFMSAASPTVVTTTGSTAPSGTAQPVVSPEPTTSVAAS